MALLEVDRDMLFDVEREYFRFVKIRIEVVRCGRHSNVRKRYCCGGCCRYSVVDFLEEI